MVKVSIKWGKEKFDEIEMDQNQPLQTFQGVVYSLTMVPIEKQKLIFKGSVIKDDAALRNLKIQEKGTIMLMGNAEGGKPALQKPAEKTIFIEDLTPEEKARILKEKAGIVLPAGLVNLGNTCYLNSSIQCLRRINELKEYFVSKSFANSFGPEQKLAKEFSQLIKTLDKSGESIPPYNFIEIFMNIFPQFAERTQEGVFRQQDADECFQNVLNTLEPVCETENLEGEKISLIQSLFQIKFQVSFKNIELPEEPEKIAFEYQKKLICTIDNQGNPINHLTEGIEASLKEEIEKKSEIDNQNHIYQKIQKISSTPRYLLVQLNRFFWKQASAIAGTGASKAKILRNVSFPKILDLFPFCTEELQTQLKLGRDYEKKKQEEALKNDEDKFEKYKQELEKSGQMISEDSKQLFKRFKASQKEEEIKKQDEELYQQHGFGLETGNYQLIAVLTHKGRTADSGHYVGWVHKSGDDWYKYDDDVVSIVGLEDILNLRGGGDWHMAYYCLYRKLEIQ